MRYDDMRRVVEQVRERWAGMALLPLRLLVGFGLLAHGIAKWNKGPEALTGILHAVGVPSPHFAALLTIATEIVGGAAMMLGAFVPWISVPSAILLLTAAVTVHRPYGFSSIKLLRVVGGRAQFGPPGYECDLLYLAAIAALVLHGPTPWSLDRFRSRRGA